ncbi:MAG: flagellar brake protein [Dechloromonas sp.]|nr:flagellar brake protein [Dechloromonas sp.]
MLDDDRKFIRVTADDIELAKPLRWTLYDGNRQIIKEKGGIFGTQADIEAALVIGGYRLPDEASGEVGNAILRPERAVETARAAAKTGSRVLSIAFENSKIRIGDTLVLQSAPDQPRFPVRLIGYLRNRSVIVTPPEINGEVVMVRDGQSFVGRFFSGQNAFAFSTSVSKQTSVPYPHIHLAYPRELKVQEVRKSPRVDVSLIAAIEFEGKGGQTAGKLINLSPTGAGFRAKQACGAPGDKFLLKFKLTINGLDTVVNVRSEVCSVREMSEELTMPFLHGVRFVEVEESIQFALSAFVYGSLLGEN